VRIAANEQTLPRLHLIGTLAIVLALTLSLGAYFSWRSAQDHRASIERIAQTVTDQRQARLQSELDSAISYIDFTRSRTEDILRKNLREQVDVALQMAQAIYTTESPRRPAEAVKRLIIEALRPVRFFDGRGYYFIDDMSGRVVLMPISTKAEGKSFIDVKDDTGYFIVRGLIEAARLPAGQGFIRYRYFTPESRAAMNDKLAYVRHFAPYDWLIGTGDYTYKWDQQQQREVIDRLRSVDFGHSGYISLLDKSGRVLLSRQRASLEGLATEQLPAGQRAIVEQMFAKASQGGGVVHYQWISPQGDAVNRTAVVKKVEPWGWTVIVSISDDVDTVVAAAVAGVAAGGGRVVCVFALVEPTV